ncbi:MAG: DUF1800 domain-containing protein [Blastocatellia bacterium]|nr:DUF1800 domain-containing protein [Blastocatellia bacterium]
MTDMTYKQAAHLLGRMGFGGPPAEIESLASRGREGAVDYLLNYEQIDDRQLEDALKNEFPFRRDVTSLNARQWWFVRMVMTQRPFEEKMTLFWHNHFATSLEKVDETLIFVQNLMLRQNALARFDDLLLKVARDPAMLVWLDGVVSVKENPNENFGRELLELFTMSVNDVVTGEANYTEQDVKEIARAFTGWRFKQPKKFKLKKLHKYKFVFQPNENDAGIKTVFGQPAAYTGEDIISIVCARRATARFLVWKLFEFFVYPLTSSPEDLSVIDKFADVYIASDHSIKEMVRAIFLSEEFTSDRAERALVKSPADMVASSLRMLGIKFGGSLDFRNYSLQSHLNRMGMTLYAPPNVSGWALSLGWISSNTMVSRYNFAGSLISNRLTVRGPVLSNSDLMAHARPSAEETVNNFLRLLGLTDIDQEAVRNLMDYLQTGDDGLPVEFEVNDSTVDNKVRGLVHQIMCLAEFQLN